MKKGNLKKKQRKQKKRRVQRKKGMGVKVKEYRLEKGSREINKGERQVGSRKESKIDLVKNEEIQEKIRNCKAIKGN